MDSKTMMAQPSIADISDGYWRSNILGIRDIPDETLDFQRVPLDSAPGNFEGDIDILLCSQSQPYAAITIEVKRIKVGAEALRSGQPNKLHEYKKGVAQANVLARIGFSQVYLCVLVVVDSREQNVGRISYAGSSAEIRNLGSPGEQ